MTGIDPFEAFVLGVVLTLVVGFLWLRLRWSRTSSAGLSPPPPGSLLEKDVLPVPTAPAGASPKRDTDPHPSPTGAPAVSDLRLSERVVLHLDRFDHTQGQEVASFMLCQQGIVEKLGVRQSALTKVLQRLVAAGAVAESTEHVQGQARRLKVYRLTTLGHLLAKDLRSRGRATTTPPPQA